MRGLIYKDFCLLKSVSKLLFIMLLVFGGTGIAQGEISMFTTMITMMLFVMPINCFSYDQLAGWDNFVAASPVSRRSTVAARYLVVLLLGAVAFLLTTLFGWIGSWIRPEIQMGEVLMSTVAILAVGIIMAALMFPAIYKLGVEKSRMVMVLLFLVPFVAILLLGQLFQIGEIELPAVDESLVMGGVGLSLPLALLLFFLSYLLSAHFYSRKEL